MLDLCCGSGVVGIHAARAGAQVVAVDVARRAVVAAGLNARLNGQRIEGRRGDLFAAVPGERFDIVAANPPYVPSGSSGAGAAPGRVRGAARAWEGGADGRHFIDRICGEVRGHLAPGGRLLLLQSSICGTRETVDALARSGLAAEVIESRSGPLGPIVRGRAPELRAEGRLGDDEAEEIVVIAAARAAAGQSSSAPKVSQVLASPPS